MRNYLTLLISLFVQLSSYSQVPLEVRKFSTHELMVLQKQDQKPWLQFLDELTIEAGLYHLNTSEVDHQPVNDFDEIYYVLKGKASLQAGDTAIAVLPGSIVYVKAQVPHHFYDIKKDLDILV